MDHVLEITGHKVNGTHKNTKVKGQGGYRALHNHQISNGFSVHFKSCSDWPTDIFLSRGLLYGESVFTTIYAEKGILFFFKDHIQRLYEGLQFIYGDLLFNGNDLGHFVKRCLGQIEAKSHEQESYRITLFISSHEKELADQISLENLNFLLHRKIVSHLPKTSGITLSVENLEEVKMSKKASLLKTNNYLARFKSLRLMKKQGIADDILYTWEGKVLESTTSNVFFIMGEKIVTPKLDANILSGITRKKLLQFLADEGIPVFEQDVFLEDLWQFDGVFVTNSLRGITPIHQIVQGEKSKSYTLRPLFQNITNLYLKRRKEDKTFFQVKKLHES